MLLNKDFILNVLIKLPTSFSEGHYTYIKDFACNKKNQHDKSETYFIFSS